jgi:hypothetical protein
VCLNLLQDCRRRVLIELFRQQETLIADDVLPVSDHAGNGRAALLQVSMSHTPGMMAEIIRFFQSARARTLTPWDVIMTMNKIDGVSGRYA